MPVATRFAEYRAVLAALQQIKSLTTSPTFCLCSGDITSEAHCKSIVDKTVHQYGKINILVNNAAFQVRLSRATICDLLLCYPAVQCCRCNWSFHPLCLPQWSKLPSRPPEVQLLMQCGLREQGQYVWDISELSHERVEYAFRVCAAATGLVVCLINRQMICFNTTAVTATAKHEAAQLVVADGRNCADRRPTSLQCSTWCDSPRSTCRPGRPS